MIIYDLICDEEHRFEGWFGSADDFHRQDEGGLLSCPLCGTSKVTRVPAPLHIGKGSSPRAEREQVPAQADAQAGGAQHVINMQTAMLAKLVDYVMKNTEDVGEKFSEEARRIHYKEAPERQIRGRASSDEVAELREEGIEVMALPVSVPEDRGSTH